MKAVRSILLVIVFLLVFLVFKAPVFAQGNIPQATTTNYQTRDLNVWSQNVVYEVMSAFSCQLAGVNFSHKDQKCLGFDPKTGQLGFVDNGGGALGLLTGGIAMLYTAPAHTGQYVSYLSQSFGVSKPSYAQESQGIGFDSINPIIGIWAVFRDISYLLFIFVFIIIGVAIMLRAKIDPRTVMTIQNQIPKLIIGIIMVTLSFAIAGLLIDFMWVSTYVVIRVMNTANNNIDIGKTTQKLNSHAIGFFDQTVSYGDQTTGQGAGGLFNLAQKGAGSVQETINSSFGQASSPNSEQNVTPRCSQGDIFCNGFFLITDSVSNVFQGGLNITNGVFKLVTGDWADLAEKTVGGVLSGVVGFLVSWLIGGIAFFIILILLLWNLFKLWIFLLKCYIGILVDIIFAPFWILGGLIPGASSLGFTGWLKDLLGNLAVFPATVGLFLLAKLFVDISDNPNYKEVIFVPPLIGNFAGGLYTLGPLIALGFVLAAPHVAEGVKKSFKEKFSIDLSGAGESIKTAQGMGLAFLSTARNRLYKEHVTQSGEKFPRGILANPVEEARRGISDRFWGSSLGRNVTLQRVRKATLSSAKDEKGRSQQDLFDERMKDLNMIRAKSRGEPATPPPGQEITPHHAETTVAGGGEGESGSSQPTGGPQGGISPVDLAGTEARITGEVRKVGEAEERERQRRTAIIPPRKSGK